MSDFHAVVAQIERASEEAVKQWAEEVGKRDPRHRLAPVLEVIITVIGGLLCLASLVP